MRHSLLTRLLHAGIALAVITQLIDIGLAELPKPSAPGNLAFAAHQYVGLTTLGLLAAFWLWSLLRQREQPFAALVPWFSAGRRGKVWADLRGHVAAARRQRLPEPTGETPLASAVHGLGLIVVTTMAATGTVVFVAMGPAGALPGWAETVLEVHQLTSKLVWAYLIAHAALALLHEVMGHRVLRGMAPGLE